MSNIMDSSKIIHKCAKLLRLFHDTERIRDVVAAFLGGFVIGSVLSDVLLNPGSPRGSAPGVGINPSLVFWF